LGDQQKGEIKPKIWLIKKKKKTENLLMVTAQAKSFIKGKISWDGRK